MDTITAPVELVQLVDEHDEPTEVLEKMEAHKGEGRRHRAISVFLFNNKNKVLFQQRSAKKIVGAGQWANTCCGNVWPNESYEQCARRRLQHELGIVLPIPLTPLDKFEYHVQCNREFSEWEIDQIFVGTYEGPVEPNPEEVAQAMWLSIAEVEQRLEVYPDMFAPWFPILLQQPQLAKIWMSHPMPKRW